MTDYVIFKKVTTTVRRADITTKDEAAAFLAENPDKLAEEARISVWIEVAARTLREAVTKFGDAEYAQAPRRSWRPERLALETTPRLRRG